MRRAGIVLTALFATTPVVVAQTTPGTTPQVPMGLGAVPGGPRPVAAVIPVANAPVAPALAKHLQAWEAKNKGVTSSYTECEYATKDMVRLREVKFTGLIMCMKPNLAKMRIDNVADKNDYKAYIADGKAVHEYLGVDKTVMTYKIPPGGKGGVGDNLLMEFMSGLMTADDVVQRFDVKLDKEEDYYVHLKISPRLEKDKREFDSMLLVLYSSKLADRKWDYLPAVCRISKNNGQEVDTWTFKDHKLNLPSVTAALFAAPPVPQGWSVKNSGSTLTATPTGGLPMVPVTPKK